MSLVNEMLRDLEARRASPQETAPFAGMAPVDDDQDERLRDRLSRQRPLWAWFAGCGLLAVLLGMSLKLVLFPEAAPKPVAASAPLEVVERVEPVAPPVAKANVQAVLPQNQADRFVLQLLLDKPVSYERRDEDGAISLRLPATALPQGLQQGRVQREPLVLSWRLEQQGDEVQLLLVALGGTLQVNDRLESVADRWQLWLEVSPAAIEPELDVNALPVAQEPESISMEVLSTPAPSEQPMPAPTQQPAPQPAQRAQPTAQSQVSVTPRYQDDLARGKQALLAQDYRGAVTLLERAHRERRSDQEISAWLAKAYLSAGMLDQVLTWLPEQIRQQPRSSELRMLLARAQLEQGQAREAAQTLNGYLPPISKEPAYHALLAATYQQINDWPQSAARYQDLVRMQPGQGSWQLGLAIALEQQGQLRPASDHYRLALGSGTLKGVSSDYARTRLQALLKELGDE
ncbi:tetratricopeptide repeat protein [Atopomonas sediminilitoris]|uniref:tetratricopeptide repeat protein n=1 Tax=Atopomonas sediminilitoris TaxID=2919919 RepID=UPI001F4EC86D|nr:tetratricopeptide repeat protein [Atopomonas sediminilitoris]MCJ8168405.1 tetratricopeptide repeat protein [Atopomonas sediminilitoris]